MYCQTATLLGPPIPSTPQLNEILKVSSLHPPTSSTRAGGGGGHSLQSLTPSMQHGHHDGWEPRCLAVAGMELVLEVREEDTNAAGEAQCQPLQHHCSQQDHPCPPLVLGLGSAASCCLSLGHDSSVLLYSSLLGKGVQLPCSPQPSKQAFREQLMVFLRLRAPLCPTPFPADTRDFLLCISSSTSLPSHYRILAQDCLRNHCLLLLYFTRL